MADDIAVLGIEIDSRDARDASRDLNSLTDAARKAETQTDKLEREMSLLNRQVRDMLAPMQQLRSMLLAIGGAVAVREIIQLADAYTLTTARLRLVTSSTAELQRVQQQLFQLAQQTGSSFQATAELYTRMARNADALGLSTDQMVRVNDLFTKSLKISGVSAQETDSVIRQFTQSLTKGKVSGDEFNSLLENAGGLLDHVAKGLGITTQALVRMGKDGGVATQLILQGLGRSGAMIDTQFATLPKTVGDGIQRVKNAFGQYIDVINQSAGTTNQLSVSIERIAGIFSDPEFIAGGQKFANDLGAGLDRVVEFGPLAVNVITTVGSAVGLIIDGWSQLPEEVQTYGLIAAMLFGKKGIAVAAGIGGAIDAVPRYINGLQNVLDRVVPGDTGALKDFSQHFMEGFNKPLDGVEDFVRLNQEANSAMVRGIDLAGQMGIGLKNYGAGLGNLNITGKETLEWTKENVTAWDQMVGKIDPAVDAYVELTEQINLIGKAQKLGNISQAEANALMERANRTYGERVVKEDRLGTEVRETMQGLRDQVAVLREEAQHGEAAARRLEMEIQLREKLKGEYGANADEIQRLLRELGQWNAAIDRNNELATRSQAASQAWVQIWKNAIEEVQRAAAQLFVDMFDGGSSILRNLANIFKQTFGQIAAQQVFGGVIAGAGGGGMGGAAAGASGGILGGLMAGGGLSSLPLWGQGIMGAGMGALAGGALGGALGLNKTGSQIGGALGGFGALPFMLAGGNPLIGAGVAIATTLIGGAVGKLFGGKPSDHLEGSIYNFQTGGLVENDLGPGKDSTENRQAVNSVIERVKQITELVKGAGGQVGIGSLLLEAGNNSGFQVAMDAAFKTRFDSIESAFAAITDNIVDHITGVGPIVKQAFEVVDLAGDPANAAALIQFAQEVEKFLEDNGPASEISELQKQFNALDAQLETFRAGLVAIGQSAELATPLIEQMRQELVDGFVVGLDRQLNGLRGNGFLNEIMDTIEMTDRLRENALTAGTGLDKVDEIFRLSIKGIAQSVVDAAGSIAKANPQLEIIRQTFGAMPDLLAAITGLVEPLNSNGSTAADLETQRLIEESEKRVRELRITMLTDELKIARETQAATRDKVQSLGGVLNATDNALLRLATDATFGLSAQQRHENVSVMFEEAKKAAGLGDYDAQQKLPDLGLKLLELSREINASGQAFWQDRDMVEATLKDQRSIAAIQLDVAKATLVANEAQVALLQQWISGAQSKPLPGSSPTQTGGSYYDYKRSDFQAIFDQYAADVANGANRNALVAQYEPTLFEMYGNTSDMAFLQEMLSYANMERATGSGEVKASAQRRYDVISKQIASLTGRDIGGTAPMAFRAHPNEIVFLGNKAQVLTSSQAQGAITQGVTNNDRMEQAYRIGTQAQQAATRELIEEVRDLRKINRAQQRELRRIKEKVGSGARAR